MKITQKLLLIVRNCIEWMNEQVELIQNELDSWFPPRNAWLKLEDELQNGIPPAIIDRSPCSSVSCKCHSASTTLFISWVFFKSWMKGNKILESRALFFCKELLTFFQIISTSALWANQTWWQVQLVPPMINGSFLSLFFWLIREQFFMSPVFCPSSTSP